MRNPPYDDVVAFDRRWFHCDPADADARQQAQPLLFVADHISIHDRRAGSLAVYARTADDQPLMAVIPDALPDPSADECLRAMLGIADNVCREFGIDPEVMDLGDPPFAALGLVHHRRGRPHITDVDRHWAQALTDVCGWLGVEPIGVLARTESGALVPVPLPNPREPDVLRDIT